MRSEKGKPSKSKTNKTEWIYGVVGKRLTLVFAVDHMVKEQRTAGFTPHLSVLLYVAMHRPFGFCRLCIPPSARDDKSVFMFSVKLCS